MLKNIFLFFLLLNSSISFSQEIQSSFNVDMQLFDASGNNPLEDPNVSLRIQILNSSKTCVLYDETRNGISTQDTKGYLSIQVGTLVGNPRRTAGSDVGNDFKKIFLNNSPINGSGSNCSGSIYIPSANDIRYLRVVVSSSTFSNSLLSPDIILSSSPISVNSSQLNGKSENEFIQTNSTVTQTNANLLFSNTNSIISLLNNSSNFLTNASLSNYVTQTSLITQLSGKQNNLGFTPLNPSNNLSDVSNISTARSNLGLGSASTKNAPSSGNASNTEVVLGNDTRLTDSRPPVAHTHVLSQITDAGDLASLNTVPNDKTTGTSLSIPNTLVLRDSNGNFESSNIYSNNNVVIGNSSSSDLILSNTDAVLSNPYGVNAGSTIIQKYGKGNLAIMTENNSDNDATPTDHLVFETGGKFSGTGESGSMLFSPGPSVGGLRGNVYFDSHVMPTEDAFYDFGTKDDRWANIWGSFISASDSIGLRDPTDAAPVMTISIFNNGTNTGPFIRGPFKSGQYSGFGIMGRDNSSNNSFNTEYLWITTGNKINGTGGSGGIIVQPGFTPNGGPRGDILLNSLVNLNFNRIGNVANPINSGDAVNKGYVDGIISSTNSSLALVATTGNYNDLNNKPILGLLAAQSSVGNSQITDLSYSKLTDVPSSFTPTAHTHGISDVTGLQAALNSKVDTSFINNAVANAGCTSSQTLYWNSVASQLMCQTITLTGTVSGDYLFALHYLAIGNSFSDPNILFRADSWYAGSGDPNIYLQSKQISDNNAEFQIRTADKTTPVLDGILTNKLGIYTGNSNFGGSGPITIKTGYARYGTSGELLLETGPGHYVYLDTGGNSGNATFGSGNANDNNSYGNSGNTYIKTGNGVISGNIYLTTGPSGSRGKIFFDAVAIDLTNKNIINLANPVNSLDAANKNYVDSVATNSVKSSGMTNPKVCSFFVSNGVGVESACTSAGCTTQNINGNCSTISSVTRSSTGKYSYNFPIGFWSNPSQVNCTANFNVCLASSGICITRVSNSLLSTGRAFEFYDSTNSPQDSSFSVTCHGE